MKKLYIPTSTLNFNNIFASESISPTIFYSKRSFGYKSFEKIDLSNFDNSILLFDKLPIFEINDKERDNYPMIIEINHLPDDILLINRYNDVSIYQYFETIYLNPFTSKIYFLSKEVKEITLLGAERSLSTKMVGLYEKINNFQIADYTIPQFELSKDYLDSINDVSDKDIGKYIEIDQRKNKAKGFMYSYLLGANKSSNRELIILKNNAREISNIISAIIRTPNKSITQYQKQSLSDYANDFNTAYEKIDKETREFNEQLSQIKLSISVFKELLKNETLIEKIKNIVDIKEILDINSNLESAISKINNRITEIEKYHFSNKQKIDISQKIAFTNLKLTYLYEDKPDFYMALINDYLDIDYQQEPKLEIAIRGIKILIQMFEETNHLWDKSPQRIYFNKLLSHIQGKDTFNVSEGDDIKRQSFASFVLHKDNIENLETALISNLISEYRFAFGLWGVFYGFSNLPKTLTNNLFLSNDLDYISEVYKYIHKQVHNVELEGKLEKKQKECSNILEKEETKIRQNLRDKQIKDKQIEEIIEIWEKNDRMINEDLWSCILKIRGIGPKTMDKIKSCFLPNKQQTSNHHGYSQQNNRNKQPIQSLFQKESSNSFLTDLEFLLNNDEFIKIVSKHKDWENDLRWFIESHGKSHKDYETYWNDKSIDNESIIKQFISFKKGRYKDSENLLKRLYLQDEG